MYPMMMAPGDRETPASADAVDHPLVLIELHVDGILCFRYKPGVRLELAEAREIVALAGELTHGKPHPSLVDMGAVRSVSRAAREYFAGPDNTAVTSAVALLVRSTLARVIANFFLGLQKPLFPTRLFTDETLALSWLHATKQTEPGSHK